MHIFLKPRGASTFEFVTGGGEAAEHGIGAARTPGGEGGGAEGI